MEKIYYSFENSSEVFETLKEAIENYKELTYDEEFVEDFSYEENGKTFMEMEIFEIKRSEDEINAEHLVELMSNNAYDEYDDAEDYCDRLENADKTWLEENLNKVWREWKERENIVIPFYDILSRKDYKVQIENDEVVDYKEITEGE